MTYLRDVTPEMLEACRGRASTRSSRDRAEHIVHENARVLAAVAAFEAGDLETMGRLFYASHASMRDLFGISSPELDALVEIAAGVPGVIGARLTGAGFGGCTINLVRRDAVRRPPRGGHARLPGADGPHAARVRGGGVRRRPPDRLSGWSAAVSDRSPGLPGRPRRRARASRTGGATR